jgi:hypothetical protein
MANSASPQPTSDGPERPDQTIPQENNNTEEKIRPPWLLIAAFFLSSGLVLALLAWSRSSATLLFTELIVAAAALSVGGLLGFLFGMPRGRIKEVSSDEQPRTDASIDYQPSNNLEQISDWLTKILIGVGLVELKELVGILRAIGQAVEGSFAGALTGTIVITQAVLVMFVVLGFYVSFLWTRIYYGPLQTLTDNEVIRRLRNQVVTLKSVARQLAKGEIATPDIASARKAVRAARGDSQDPSNWPADVLEKIKRFRESEKNWYSNPTQEIFGNPPQETNGRRLEAEIKVDLGSTLVIDLIVRRVSARDQPLVGPVAFLLHPTFTDSVLYAQGNSESARVKITTSGWFTVVAIMDEGNTILSYDLNKLPNAPQWFKAS